MADAESTHRLARAAVRTLWLFQALTGGLLSLLWAVDILRETRNPSYGSDAYHATKELFLAILAAVIVYAVIVQWQYPDPLPKITARFELAKGLLATAVWLYLLLDAILYIPDYDPYCRRVFFYPTVFWSARLARKARKQETAIGGDTTAGENTPLLRGV
ncbi:hypothetical protein INS49_005854 [Diaporthe citri]|uniref:uncharacterized protein n=1 Tax=Diaporthe citri TaxID=83186 RepID=UPI001C7E3712|nr:uncharacterized protein INS49_005854 [Diaporthe citri]KAG6364255.1 hypothetical protein INS49_005854 [Diaporthe citri]